MPTVAAGTLVFPLLVGLAIFGCAVYALVMIVPMPAAIRKLVVGVAVVCALLYLADAADLWGYVNAVRI